MCLGCVKGTAQLFKKRLERQIQKEALQETFNLQKVKMNDGNLKLCVCCFVCEATKTLIGLYEIVGTYQQHWCTEVSIDIAVNSVCDQYSPNLHRERASNMDLGTR